MIPVAILAFLVGPVLASGFRVWILLPVSLLAFVLKMVFDLGVGTDFLTATEQSVVIAVLPQLGYAFGLMARTALVVLRSPRKGHVAILGQRRSVNGA